MIFTSDTLTIVGILSLMLDMFVRISVFVVEWSNGWGIQHLKCNSVFMLGVPKLSTTETLWSFFSGTIFPR